MTHMNPMKESDGELGAVTTTKRKCGTCGEEMLHQTWESSDGAYEDSKYTCPRGHVEWVDGIDS